MAVLEDDFAEWIAGDRFSCLGARAAARRGVLITARFGPMGESPTTAALHRAVETFTRQMLSPGENFASFVAVFDGPAGLTEQQFENKLWDQLAELHMLDKRRYAWSPEVSADPACADYGFSLAGHAFFVVGMHDGASRISRRFALPAMAFNPHSQFRRLRAEGIYDGLKERIRERELRLQGSLKPDLAEHGTDTEAKQYAGRAVEQDWVCPMRAGVTP